MKNESNFLAKVTLILGSAQVLKLGVGVLRGKAISIMFGPAGIALWGLYQSFIDAIQSFALLGLEKGGIQDLSKSKDLNETSYKALVLFGLVLFFVLVILLIINIVSFLIPESYKFITNWMFEISLIFAVLNVVGIVILNSLQEYKKLALTQLYGVLVGNTLAIISLYFLGIKFTSLAFLVLNLSLFLFTFYSVFFILEKNVSSVMPISTVITKFISLGLPFWFTQVLTSSGLLLINILIEHYAGVKTLGFYIAAWAIANIFSNILFSTFSSSFFPRLCKKISDHENVDKLVNWQINFGILLFSFGSTILFLFPKTFITILYTQELFGAADIIRWLVLGSMLRMIGFPLGYAIMGYEKSIYFIIGQVVFNIFNVSIVFLILIFGYKELLGINFLITYIIYIVLLWCISLYILKLNLSFFALGYYIVWVLTMFITTTINSTMFSVVILILLTISTILLMQKKLNIDVKKLLLQKVKK